MKRHFILVIRKGILKFALDLYCLFCNLINTNFKFVQPTSTRNAFGNNSWTIGVRLMELYVEIYRSKHVYKLAFSGGKALAFNMLLSNCVITELTELVCVKV
jgi:hypothetical protein